MERKKVAFAVAMKRFFGLREGQSLGDFAKEIRELSFEEKMDFAAGLRSIGIDCENPVMKSQ